MLLIRLAISLAGTTSANRRLHFAAGAGGFFNARRSLGAHVQVEASGVGAGEEILAQPRH